MLWVAASGRSTKVNPGRLTLTPEWNQQAEISSPPVNSSGMQKGYSQGGDRVDDIPTPLYPTPQVLLAGKIQASKQG